MESKQHTTKQQDVIEEIKEEIKKYFEKNENGNTTFQHLCNTAQAVSSEREVYTNTDLPQVTRKNIK